MNNLTIALASLGVLVLVALGVHGVWSARSAARKQLATRQARHAPPGAPGGADAFTEQADVGDAGDSLARAVAGAAGGDGLRAKRQAARIEALIDAIATLSVDAPVSGEQLMAHLPGSWRAGSKPFLIEGLDAASGQWEPLLPGQIYGQHYGELQAGVQLANRSGAINEIEYSEFVQTLQRFADALGATIEFPDMLDVVARGRELDAFAGQHDAQLAVHLNARSAAWSVGYVVQHASRHGFVPGAVAGRLVLPAGEDGAPPVVTLSFDANAALAALADDPQRSVVRDVTLSFDVPQTDPRFAPFVAWQASARALSLGMDAAIVDDQGQPIDESGFATIGAELDLVYANLRERDLAAGSLAARRLFS
ncbi:MAG: cell division protein FtsZ [Burkholderiaceae bacterium]